MKKTPKFAISVVASATVRLLSVIQADTPELAKKTFLKRLDTWKGAGLPGLLIPDVEVVEAPHIGHDYEEDDIEVEEL